MIVKSELLLLLADPPESAKSDAAPWWFTGILGLVGTVIGGLITYRTTRDANLREARAERERQRQSEIREISIRFIRLISRPQLQQEKIQEMTGKFGALLDGVSQGKDPAQVVAEIQGLNPLSMQPATDSSLMAILGTFKEMGRMAPYVSESQALLAEMRLLVPNRIVQIAEIANDLAFKEQLMASMGKTPQEVSDQPVTTLQEVLVIFTDELRKEMGADPYEYVNATDQGVVREFLSGLSRDTPHRKHWYSRSPRV